MRIHRRPTTRIWSAESWGLLGYLAAMILALTFWLATIAGEPRESRAVEIPIGPEPVIQTESPLAGLRELVDWGEEGLEAWSMLLFELCTDPELLTRQVHVSCENGSLTLSEEAFFGSDGVTLSAQGEERLREAFPIYLDRLRGNGWLWPNIESIEIRGHSDAFAQRDPYRVNLLSSQRRALAVVRFLTSDPGIAEADREDLMRIATVSGASFSRPPERCASREPGCRPSWRRVEVRLNLAEEKTRAGFIDYQKQVRALIDSAASPESD